VREGLRAVAIDGLPRCGPFKLHHGPAAMAQAAAAMAAALDGGCDAPLQPPDWLGDLPGV
jgi:hypothetical protein